MKNFIILILIIIGAFFAYKHFGQSVSSGSDRVILFTAENCPPCKDAAMFLDKNEVKYISVPIQGGGV